MPQNVLWERMNLLLEEAKKFSFKKVYSLLTGADKILIFFLLIFAVASFFILANNHNDEKIIIYYQGKFWGKYSTKKNMHLHPAAGIDIEIKNGKVRMLHSTCKNKYCVKQGWSSSYPIICLPNKIIIKFEDKENMLITR